MKLSTSTILLGAMAALCQAQDTTRSFTFSTRTARFPQPSDLMPPKIQLLSPAQKQNDSKPAVPDRTLPSPTPDVGTPVVSPEIYEAIQKRCKKLPNDLICRHVLGSLQSANEHNDTAVTSETPQLTQLYESFTKFCKEVPDDLACTHAMSVAESMLTTDGLETKRGESESDVTEDRAFDKLFLERCKFRPANPACRRFLDIKERCPKGTMDSISCRVPYVQRGP